MAYISYLSLAHLLLKLIPGPYMKLSTYQEALIKGRRSFHSQKGKCAEITSRLWEGHFAESIHK